MLGERYTLILRHEFVDKNEVIQLDPPLCVVNSTFNALDRGCVIYAVNNMLQRMEAEFLQRLDGGADDGRRLCNAWETLQDDEETLRAVSAKGESITFDRKNKALTCTDEYGHTATMNALKIKKGEKTVWEKDGNSEKGEQDDG